MGVFKGFFFILMFIIAGIVGHMAINFHTCNLMTLATSIGSADCFKFNLVKKIFFLQPWSYCDSKCSAAMHLYF